MDSAALIDRLQANADRVAAMLHGIPLVEARWRPAPEKWSILEVAVHLLDEEREDFRTRVDVLLHHPGTKPPSIDPQGWVTERNYNERDLEETMRAFLAERETSIHWLRELRAPVWENRLEHPSLGPLHAGDVLAAWVAHDLLHIRQLARLHWERVGELAEPYSLTYAGDW